MLSPRPLILLLLLTGCVPQQNVGGVIEDTAIIETIKTEQESLKTTNGDYEQISKATVGNYEYEVHVYKTPTGEKGYTVYLRETRADGVYEKVEAHGVEAKNRIKDWYLKEEIKTATTTR